jgi:hypothetical protein
MTRANWPEHVKLAAEHGGTFGEHPAYPVADWQLEVTNDNTRRGYWEWVAANLELDA